MKSRLRIALVLVTMSAVAVTANAMLLGDSARFSGPSCVKKANGVIQCN